MGSGFIPCLANVVLRGTSNRARKSPLFTLLCFTMTLTEVYVSNNDVASAALDAIVETLSAHQLKLTDDTEQVLWDELHYLAGITRVVREA